MVSGTGTAAQPRQLAVLAGTISSLIVDGNELYFVLSNGSGDRLMQLPKPGGCPKEIFQQNGIDHLVADATYLYYASKSEGLARLRKDGSSPSERIGIPVSSSLLSDETNLYFVKGSDVVRLEKGALQEMTLNSWPGAAALALDNQAIYIGRQTGEIAFDDGTIVRVDGGVRRVSKDGTGVAKVTGVSAEALVAEGEWLYFRYGPALNRIPKSGGTITQVGTLAFPRGIRAAAGYVYGFGRNYLVAFDASLPPGSPPSLSIATLHEVRDVGVDSTGIYYAEDLSSTSSALLHIAR